MCSASWGLLSTEDLWDLSLEALNAVYQVAQQQLKEASAESLLAKPTAEAERLALKVEVVKFVFGVKAEEAEARKALVERKAQKAQIMDIIAEKQVEGLKGKSVDDLRKMLEEL